MTRLTWSSRLTPLGGAVAACAFLVASCISSTGLDSGDASVGDTSAIDVPPPVDAATDRGSDGIAQDAPSYACGPADAGVRCSCGVQPYFPAPVNAVGQPQTNVLMPAPAAVVGYSSLAEFDALAVGRWQRTAGMGELICEQYGVDFTADHRLVPLVVATDGTVQEVAAQTESFTLTFGTQTRLSVDNGGLLTNAPIFFDGGQSMYFNFSPWPADYARVAGP